MMAAFTGLFIVLFDIELLFDVFYACYFSWGSKWGASYPEAKVSQARQDDLLREEVDAKGRDAIFLSLTYRVI